MRCTGLGGAWQRNVSGRTVLTSLVLTLAQEIEEDEEDLQDTTWQQVQTGTRDMQGIPWSSTPYSREDYRVRM